MRRWFPPERIAVHASLILSDNDVIFADRLIAMTQESIMGCGYVHTRTSANS